MVREAKRVSVESVEDLLRVLDDVESDRLPRIVESKGKGLAAVRLLTTSQLDFDPAEATTSVLIVRLVGDELVSMMIVLLTPEAMS